MPILRRNVDYAKGYLRARNGLAYGYGGQFSDTNLSRSTDCSGLAFAAVAGCIGRRMDVRYGSTEALLPGSWEYGRAGINTMGLVHAGNDRRKVPEDAVVKLGLQHGGGGRYSHVSCTIDGVNAESRGAPGGVIYNSVKRGTTVYYARAWNDKLFHNFWYLPGPIEGGQGPAAAPTDGARNTDRPTVHLGSTGEHVRALQARLNRDYPLYSRLVIDGVFGPATDAVVREFQGRAGLFIDGVAGPRTWEALGL